MTVDVGTFLSRDLSAAAIILTHFRGIRADISDQVVLLERLCRPFNSHTDCFRCSAEIRIALRYTDLATHPEEVRCLIGYIERYMPMRLRDA